MSPKDVSLHKKLDKYLVTVTIILPIHSSMSLNFGILRMRLTWRFATRFDKSMKILFLDQSGNSGGQNYIY